MSIYYTVYKTTNLVNGKQYIGAHRSKNPNDSYLGTNRVLKRAIKKHGIKNFKKEILFIFDNEIDMFKKEKELVTEEFCQREDTYNIGEGGRGWTGLGQYIVDNRIGILELSFEERSKISKETQANRDPEERKAMCSKGGKIGSQKGIENKSGIHGMTPEQRKQNAKNANTRLK